MLAAVPEHGVPAAGASSLSRIEASLAKSEAAAARVIALMADLGLDLDMGGKFICTVICCPHMDSLFFI
jgi:hypothetical protein